MNNIFLSVKNPNFYKTKNYFTAPPGLSACNDRKKECKYLLI